MIDSVGESVLTQTYDPYGNPYASSGTGETHLGFTGEFVDPSGLVYLRARYYQPGMGRFLSADPSRLERNLYGYGGANPVMFADPSGHRIDDEDQTPRPWHVYRGYSIGSCYGDWFCETYGQDIANRAWQLSFVGRFPDPDFAGSITPANIDSPPPWSPWQAGQMCSYVCMDIIRDVYEASCIDIEQTLQTEYQQAWGQDANRVLSRSADAYFEYLYRTGEFHFGDEFPYVAGEVAVLYDYDLYDRVMAGEIPCEDVVDGDPNHMGCTRRREDSAGFHGGIVVRGGMTVDEVRIAQLSYSAGEIQIVSLREYVFNRTAQYGYARDTMFERGDNPYADPWPSGDLEEGIRRRDAAVAADPASVLHRFVFHGHPAQGAMYGCSQP